ncbi:mevalonate kinase [Culex quinquefasciatus]|uniref:Mevalonate kinase n=1 Tax=Culex quinquefasciatus TaxID=7176 RepID=B0X7S2_CULQU|nr:mevalonate kinase [Culex quinquefasciatus]|eukprot:XP_001865694.1 mevalonate kinase [Culex quinquefasciatus]
MAHQNLLGVNPTASRLTRSAGEDLEVGVRFGNCDARAAFRHRQHDLHVRKSHQVSRTTAKLVADVADLKNRHPGMLDSMGHLVDDVVSILKDDGDRFEELRTLVSINGDRRLRKTLLSMEPHFVGHDDLNHLLQLLEQHSLIISEKKAERGTGRIVPSDDSLIPTGSFRTRIVMFTELQQQTLSLFYWNPRHFWISARVVPGGGGAPKKLLWPSSKLLPVPNEMIVCGTCSANNFSANLLKIADQTVKPLMWIVEHFGMVLVQDPVADSLRSVPFTLSYDQAEIVVMTEPEQLVQGRTESCRARSKRVRIATSGSPGLLINLVPACRNLFSWLPYRRKTSRATIFNLCCQSGVRSNKSLEFNAAVDVELAWTNKSWWR